MNKSDIRIIRRSIARLADEMSVYGLKGCIADDVENPQWDNELFDLMTRTLERKIGKRAFTVWFNALPVGESK